MLKSFYHTGFIVRDLERSVEFYTNVLGLETTRRMEREGEFINQVLGFPNAHIKGAFMGQGEGHLLELIQYISPPSGPGGIERNDIGATHLGFFVENLAQFYADKSHRGLRFLNPPAEERDANGNLVRSVAYSQDPDGNWLEFVEIV